MQLNELKDGQLARITCKAVNKINHNTLMTWVDEFIVVGEVITFSNHANYGGEWTIIDIDKVDTYENCKAKFGRDDWFLSKINRGDNNEQDNSQ